MTIIGGRPRHYGVTPERGLAFVDLRAREQGRQSGLFAAASSSPTNSDQYKPHLQKFYNRPFALPGLCSIGIPTA